MACPILDDNLIWVACAPTVVLPAGAIRAHGGVTSFSVEVTPAQGSASWSVMRRYTDFVRLRNDLGLAEDSLPPFPPKLLMLRCRPERLEARRTGLEAWLLAVLQAPSARCVPAVCRFLTTIDRPDQEAPLRHATSFFEPVEPVDEDADEVVFFGPSSWPRLHGRNEPLPTSGASRTESTHANSYTIVLPSRDLEAEQALTKGEAFDQCHSRIARDIIRTYYGNVMVDKKRISIINVLRSYALQDPELGYTQGMNYPAAAICLQNDGPKVDEQFGNLMKRFRGLWMPGFPLMEEGFPLMEALLGEHDGELLSHFSSIHLDLRRMVLPKAWLTLFARWLPLPSFIEILPFLISEGLPGILTVTLMLVLFHRWFLLRCGNIEEALVYLGTLPDRPPPERLLDMCTTALPILQNSIQRTAG